MPPVENRFYVLGLSRSVGIAFFLEYQGIGVANEHGQLMKLATLNNGMQILDFDPPEELTVPQGLPSTFLGEPVTFTLDDVNYAPKGVVMPIDPMSVHYSGVGRHHSSFVIKDVEALYIFNTEQSPIPGYKQIYTILDEFRAGSIFGEYMDDQKYKNNAQIESFTGIATAAARIREKLTRALNQVDEFERRAADMNFTDPKQPVQLYWDEIDKEMVIFSEGSTVKADPADLAEGIKSTIDNNLYKYEVLISKA
ncbi:hypothetical protein RYA05_03650 [Pseudomonas syringae pv. actinidiae]|nr:hypothetical protein [Pseudomonas syringae pv. actinidiae]